MQHGTLRLLTVSRTSRQVVIAKKHTRLPRARTDEAHRQFGTTSPLKSSGYTVAELVALLRSLPKPDPAFWDAVEKATKHYTEMPQSPWDR